jgi:hypothetical protein
VRVCCQLILAQPLMKKSAPNRYPAGWNAKRVASLIDYYDHQTEEEAVAEYERAYRNRKESIVHVPVDLLPKVRLLIARYRKSAGRHGKD